MRYCKKTKEIIGSSYKSATVDEIQSIIGFAGLRKRSKPSIIRYIDRLVLEDQNREKRRKKREIWALANPIRYRARTLCSGAKQRAKKRGNDFDLTEEWVMNKLKEGRCEITGTGFFIRPYSKRSEYKRVHPHSPSLDQILPSGGYTMDNVQVVCDQVNKFKGDRHTSSMVMIAENFLREYKRRNTPIITQ